MEAAALGVAILALGVSLVALVWVSRIRAAIDDAVLDFDDAASRVPERHPDPRFRTLGDP